MPKRRVPAPDDFTVDGLSTWAAPPIERHHHNATCAKLWPPRASRELPAYVSPRERGELRRPSAGPKGVPDAEVQAWIADDPFVRSGLQFKTARSLAYIARFRPLDDRAARLAAGR